VDPGDVYQMLAYAQRLGCPRLVLLYPQTAGQAAVPVVFDLTGSPARLVVAALDLHRPLERLEPLVAELAAVMRLAAALPLPASQPA
jgi:hypothetical protein